MPEHASEPHARDPTPLRPIAPVDPEATWPRPPTPFVGRRDEIEDVGDICLRADVRLLTITGPGGVGKTRLAIEVAARVADAFDDGVVFVSLAALRDPGLVPASISQALGVPVVAGQSFDERLRSFLQNKHLLLVLDNLEHLLTAGPGIADILAQHPALKILCTSRTRLGLSGEHVYPLASLEADGAIQLFTQHARARDERFGLATGDRPNVAAICDRLDRLPLAIELAAARVVTLPLDALLDRLDQRLPLLTGGPRDAPERQRTMRDTIAWSYGLLTDDEQVAFRRLSIFVDGFTLDAAASIARDGADALNLVEALVANSLIKRTQSGFGELRFMMLETIREFGLEQLAVHDEVAAVSAAHADHYVALTEAAIPHYDGPDLRMFADRVETELDNIRSALTWSLSVTDAERAVRLAGAIWRNWWAGLPPGGEAWDERVAEGRAWLERALALRDGLPAAHLAEALMGAAMLSWTEGNAKQARAYADELLKRSETERYEYGVFWAHYAMGVLAFDGGDLALATRANLEALTIAPSIRNPDNHKALALTHLGRIAMDQDDLSRAESYLTEAAVLARGCGNPHVGAETIYELGRVYHRQEKLLQAAAEFAESLRWLALNRDLGRASSPLLELSRVAVGLGRPASAVRFLAAATQLPSASWFADELATARSSVQARFLEPRFSREWEAGQQMAWEEIVGLASTLASGKGEPIGVEVTTPAHGLSPREVDVLRLLVDGHANRAIGETLSISERTVEAHVQHILAKLNLESRTGAATWAVRNGLV